jgi:hypothetical protein
MGEDQTKTPDPGSVQSDGSDAVGTIAPGICDGCKQHNEYVMTISGGVKLCRGCLEEEHPNK